MTKNNIFQTLWKFIVYLLKELPVVETQYTKVLPLNAVQTFFLTIDFYLPFFVQITQV